MSNLHPLKYHATILFAALAAGVDAALSAAHAPFAGTVTKVSYIPNALITGVTTNTRTLAVKNRGADGTGATVVASLPFINGVNAPAFDEKAIQLSGTAANLVVAEGDVLSFDSTHGGTGLADPGGLVIIEFTRS